MARKPTPLQRQLDGLFFEVFGVAALIALANPEGRPAEEAQAEGVKVLVCGQERKLAEGSWGRNHTPHCMLPQVPVDKTGRFTVPVWDEGDVRFNLWVSKAGFAPSFVPVMPQAAEVKVILKRSLPIFGHVNRRVNGKLEPVKGATVHLQCAAGDAAHQMRVFEEPYLTSVWLKEGDDRPYQEHCLTGAFGEYAFQISPPPRDKKWFVICLDEMVPLNVKEGQPVNGPEFEVAVQVRATVQREASPAATRQAK